MNRPSYIVVVAVRRPGQKRCRLRAVASSPAIERILAHGNIGKREIRRK